MLLILIKELTRFPEVQPVFAAVFTRKSPTDLSHYKYVVRFS